MKFSEREGIVKVKDVMQLDGMDNDLRNSLWNKFQIHILNKSNHHTSGGSVLEKFYHDLWGDFFKKPIDEIPRIQSQTKITIKAWFFKANWYEIYDFLEFIVNNDISIIAQQFTEDCNTVLLREMSGYRFIKNVLSKITSSEEIQEIEEAISNSNNRNFAGVKIHLESALKKLSDKKHPDYRNSIKESISAVEAVAKIISKNSKDSLGAALDKIKSKINLHPSLEKGFKQIYGYTSDADGIRHALTEQSTCDFEDAKYMLVSSSAFVNYLISKCEKSNIEI